VAFKDKFIAYVDVLGFKSMVATAEAGTGMTVEDLIRKLRSLGAVHDEERVRQDGPSICPESRHVRRDVDFRVTQVSDCVVVSAEVSPAGVIHLMWHCWGAVFRLLADGIMCRGYITRGLIHHEGTDVIGSGYQQAQAKEGGVAAFKRHADERGTPFVEVDPVVAQYIRAESDPCVREVFARQVKSDGTVTALFPFKRISHSFMVPKQGFDPKHEKDVNNILRQRLRTLRARVMALVDRNKASAVEKMEHYVAALDEQLAVCDRTDDAIDSLSQPLFTGNPRE
jgi:hypothetical protein